MKIVARIPLESAWQNNPVVQIESNNMWLSAMVDSGAGMPMYFGNRKTLEKRLGGRVLDETVSIRGVSEGKQGAMAVSYDVVAFTIQIGDLIYPNMRFAWLPDARFDFDILISYTMFRGAVAAFNQVDGSFEVNVPESPEMYVVHPYVVKENGDIYNLLCES